MGEDDRRASDAANRRADVDHSRIVQLGAEIDRIAKSTEYNGRKLLAGEGDMLEIQVGLKNDKVLDRFQYDVAKTNSTAEALGVAGLSVATKEEAQNNLDKIDKAITTLRTNGTLKKLQQQWLAKATGAPILK